jgi:hypothetical protein
MTIEEFKLPYTANEISDKLRNIDNKLDTSALNSAIENALS